MIEPTIYLDYNATTPGLAVNAIRPYCRSTLGTVQSRRGDAVTAS